ncbi:MAG: 30S ribosomal protein S8 [Candidatus Magasanikbacteria bacterium]|nr:30S ribosomal protein S8 [Candidatus Magasanikbacteria bacterium]
MMTDPIADMLTRIRNASMVRKSEAVVPFSKIKMAIAGILIREGYLLKAELVDEKKPQIALSLKYDGREPAIHSIKRISKPGHRAYVKNSDISKVLNGFGLAILSTPRGIMTGIQAKKEKIGGEILCEIY